MGLTANVSYRGNKMTQAERGLFEHLEHINGFASHDNRMLILRDATELICEEFEQRLEMSEAKLAQAESVIAQKDLALAAAKQLLAEAERDARRYKWLREEARVGTGEPFIARSFLTGISAWTKESADQAIDDAMNAPLPEKKA
jgi:hypothetical protein